MSPAAELRHIAGLTAGGSIELRPGTYHFGTPDESTDDPCVDLARHHAESLPFTLTMAGDGRVEFTAPSASDRGDDAIAFEAMSVNVDGCAATWLDDVRGATIDAGPARFRVATQHDESREVAPIAVPDRDRFDHDSFLAELVDRVHTARRAHLASLWRQHVEHDEVRTARHADFATIAIAAGDVSWRPRFDRPDQIAGSAATAVSPLHRLPSAPLTADLRHGSLAILGGRAQRLAVARSLVLSLARSSAIDDLEIAVIASGERSADWGWADQIPHTACDSATAAPVLVVDGADQLDALGLPDLLEATGGIGAIVLAEDPETLPACATLMMLNHDGSASVIDHRTGRTTMRATPIGMALDVAVGAGEALRTPQPIAARATSSLA